MRQTALDLGEVWTPARDGDPTCRAIFDRHYSRRRYADGRRPKLFVGPGEKLVLRTPAGDALAVWRRFIDDCRLAPRWGVNLAVFRNEGPTLSSELIGAACEIAWDRWPDAILYTYVDASAIRSTNPGYCFLAAGWERLDERTAASGLRVLLRRPDWHPELVCACTDSELYDDDDGVRCWTCHGLSGREG